MKNRIALLAALTLALPIIIAARPPVSSGPGHVQVGVDASVWDSTVEMDIDEGIFPIDGDGQVNGEFVTAERYGIQVGLRVQERFAGTIEATPTANNKVGVYEADAGFSSGTRATWNYDWHVDLRGARGVAKGTTLSDYDLVLETDHTDGGTLFGFPVPLDLTFDEPLLSDAVLYQSSQNPDFGNATFEAEVEDTYNFRLVLTPKTFNGPPLSVAMEVNVTTNPS